MGPQRPTGRCWSGAAQRGNAISCCSVSSAWPRCGPGKATTPLLADTAVAAVRALAGPARRNIEAFAALAQQRARDLPYGSLTSYTDGPDVAALAARLASRGG
jgi:hypothetical protein